MLSLTKNFLFIHIPKTGGNSIQTVLQNYSEDRLVKNPYRQDGVERFEVINSCYPSLKKHSNLRDYYQVLDRKTFKELYKFACIRNPWERMISLYFSPSRGVTDWSRDGFIKLVKSARSSLSFLTIRDPRWQKIFRGKSEVDFIIRFETLEEDFNQLCERLDIPKIKLPHKNKSDQKNSLDYYDNDLIKLVERKFADDIQYFDYRFSDLRRASFPILPTKLSR